MPANDVQSMMLVYFSTEYPPPRDRSPQGLVLFRDCPCDEDDPFSNDALDRSPIIVAGTRQTTKIVLQAAASREPTEDDPPAILPRTLYPSGLIHDGRQTYVSEDVSSLLRLSPISGHFPY